MGLPGRQQAEVDEGPGAGSRIAIPASYTFTLFFFQKRPRAMGVRKYMGNMIRTMDVREYMGNMVRTMGVRKYYLDIDDYDIHMEIHQAIGTQGVLVAMPTRQFSDTGAGSNLQEVLQS